LRRIAGISLILLVLGWIGLGLDRDSYPTASESQRPRHTSHTSHTTSDDAPAIRASDVAAVTTASPIAAATSQGRHGTAAHATHAGTAAAATGSLDDAGAAEIRETLTRSVEAEQQERALFIAPGLIDRIATERRARIVFDTEAGMPSDAIAALLAGPSHSAGFESLRVFPLFDRGRATVGPEALRHLIESAGTRHIELDFVHRISLDQSIPTIQGDLAHQSEYDGDGVAIAVLDTGIESSHPMLAGRVIEEACFSVQGDCPDGETEMFGLGAAIPCPHSSCGHGTRVAGIAAGDDPTIPLVGAAPHASVIAIQIFSDVAGKPGAYSSDILAALQHVLQLSAFYTVASVNLSLGGTPYTSEADCDLAVSSQRAAVGQLRAAGILTVAASGNEYLTNAVTTPACLSNVIGVGSTIGAADVSAFSNSADFLNMLAPGQGIETARLGGGTGVSNGTSMATPHVAGAIAIMLEAEPDATADEIENALVLSGAPIIDSRNDIIKPLIQVQEAITYLETMSTPVDTGDPSSSGGGGGNSTSTPSSSKGDNSNCGLVGIEPFLVLAAIRLGRRGRNRRSPLHA
jgi:subtilisin